MPPPSDAKEVQPRHTRRQALIWWGILPLLIPVLTGLLFSWHSLGDLDIWFHLRAGHDLLDGQGVTSVNRYSFTEPDHPWVNHEWMFQILTVLTGPKESPPSNGIELPDVTGWNLMRSALTLLVLLTILSGDRGISRLRGHEGPSAAAWTGVPVLVGLMLLWPRLTIRPELFSYFFLVLLVRWAEQFFRMSSLPQSGVQQDTGSEGGGWVSLFDPRRPGGRIFLLTVIWAQFHGFSSLAPLVLLMCGLLAPLQARLIPRESRPGKQGPALGQAAALVFLAFIALILTPNGWNGLLMPVRALGQFSQSQVDLRTTISELVPLKDSPNSLGLTITVYRASLVWGIVWITATYGRVSLLRVVIFALAALAAWTNQRSIGIYGVAFMLLHTNAGGNPWRFSLPGGFRQPPPALSAIAGLAITLLAAVLLWPQIVSDDFYLREGVGRRFGSGLNPARYPATAAESMIREWSRLYFANLDAAAYLLAHTSGRIFIDGRTEAYSADLWAEYLGIKRGDDQALRLLTERRLDAVCLATSGGSFDKLAVKLLDSPEWDLWTAEGAGLLFRPSNNNSPGAVAASSGNDRDLLVQAAVRTLDSAQSGSPARRADICLAAGHLFKFAGDDAQREAVYRRGLSHKSSHPTLNHNLGTLLLNQERFQEALPYFQDALEVNCRLAGSALNAGVCQMRLRQPDEAVRSFQQAAAIDPDRFEAWVNLSVALLGTGNRPGAVRALEKALELRPRDHRLQQRLKELKGGTGN
jgi:tetratricopeptide (TPR) repeat protein